MLPIKEESFKNPRNLNFIVDAHAETSGYTVFSPVARHSGNPLYMKEPLPAQPALNTRVCQSPEVSISFEFTLFRSLFDGNGDP